MADVEFLALRLVVDLQFLTATIYRGEQAVREFQGLDRQSAKWLSVLASRPGRFVSARELVEIDPELAGIRTNRVLRKLPTGLQRIIESSTRTGSRLTLV